MTTLPGTATTGAGPWSILSPVLPDSLVPAALRGVHDIDDTPSRAKALGALAPRLPAPQRTELIADALDDIARLPVGDFYWSPRSDALEGIAPAAEPTQFGRVKELAEQLSGANDFGLYRVLAALAPRVAEMGLPEEALDIIARIDPHWRDEPLGAVIEHLPEHCLDRARSLVEPLTPARRRVAVVALAARLHVSDADGLLVEAVVASATSDAWAGAGDCCTMLHDLAARISPSGAQHVLELVGEFQPHVCGSALARLHPSCRESRPTRCFTRRWRTQRRVRGTLWDGLR